MIKNDINDVRSILFNTLHALVWIQAHGPIPPGYIVRFKKGQKTIIEEEITLDKIECIPRSENMGRNSYWENLPREVAELYQLKGVFRD